MKHCFNWRSFGAVSILALTAGAGLPSSALAQVEEIIVQAQKKDEALQSVPIAVSAFDGDALQRQQIDSFSDLQFTAPNVNFSKGNFTGSNFQIRGVGVTTTSVSADTGVGIHINNVYLNSPRIFEAEYYDVERVEVLRGPQGTLYGRNATGGTVNVITKKPTFDGFEADGEIQYGNYNHAKVKGALNIPLSDTFAVRLAGIYNERDGYTDNIFTGDDVDDRNIYSVRGSARWQASDRTSVDFMVSYFEEDDTRLRSQKQLCTTDPTGILGCMPDGLGFEVVHGGASIATTQTSFEFYSLLETLASAPAGSITAFSFGSLALNQLNTNSTSINPADMRDVYFDFPNTYEADETFVMGAIEHDFDVVSVKFIAAYQETSVLSEQDFNLTVSDLLTDLPGGGVPAAAVFALPGIVTPTTLPISAVGSGTTSGTSGVLGGNIAAISDRTEGYDRSISEAEQWSAEIDISSQLEGPFNYRLGAYYLNGESEGDYFVTGTGLDYFSLLNCVLGVALLGPGAETCSVTPFFDADTDKFELESWALMGEGYWDVTDTVKLTAGLRYTVDDKMERGRQTLVALAPLLGVGASPTSVGLPTTDAATQAALLAFSDQDDVAPGVQGIRERQVKFEEFTGRFVVDWSPQLDFTQDTLVYASYSRGYKGGGFNPTLDPVQFPGVSETFEPEFLNAYEIGTKNTLFESTLQANLTAFYYDYEGLQVSKIVNRTGINENIDATIWGLEGEFLYAPNEAWLSNLAISYLNTEISDASSIDPRDPTNGDPGVTLVKDLQTASACIVDNNGLPSLVGSPLIIPSVAPSPVNGDAGFGVCSILAASVPPGYEVSDGVPVNLEGNSLQLSPEWSISAGVQRTWMLPNGLSLTPRVDYYWQDEFYLRIFNREGADLVDAWDLWNAQVTLEGPEGRWYARAFIQNIEDDAEITGSYVSDISTGTFTNVFLTEPRLFGLAVGARF